jgi:aminoglycoside phosphotransferase family enzyme/predicted kinase
MDTDLPVLIRSLLEPRRYPGAVQQVTLVQTHISWVLLAGDFAYKIKKPIRLPFLDFSTLERRQACCKDELRLNCRFAPDIYLDVVGLFNTPDDPQWDGSGAPIEYAVRMRRFDEAGRLDHLCQRGDLRPEHLSDLAGTLVDFHARAAVAPAASRFGAPGQVIAPAHENFDELQLLLPQADVQGRLHAMRRWTDDEFARLAPVMQVRKAAGRIRECHGDLHLANLVCIDGRVRMFDCIEFNEDLRWIDVASEIAFTYIDLLDHGQAGLANWFLNEALGRSGDYEAAKVLRFYAVYRALVRAKVAAIRDAQTPAAGHTEALAYLALAEQLAHPPPVRLVITHGLSGCGKTVASTQLLQSDPQAATLRLRSDVERKRLFGLPATQRSGSATGMGIYAADAHARTYQHLHAQCDMLLRAGWSVVVDAAFLRRSERAGFQALALALGVPYAILAPLAPPEVLRARIEARQALGRDASEATVEVLERQMQWIEPLDTEESTHLLDTPIRA